ncbi:MAG: MupG family TIM beta-alpha barrel fold protein [Deferribacteraceae bacterium]|jgi:hypothetical protein|nr:MupG family TIM beta-alpha barrel fold protein [Deferribacteraceae bacterium]
MLFSLYPTDERAAWERVLALNSAYGERELYCSLHIPEVGDLQDFMAFLKQAHDEKGLRFYADISPLALEKLSLSIDSLPTLFDYGIFCLRIDFGFSIEEIQRISRLGFKIALNASCVGESTIDKLEGADIIAWHNYYPRPETGVSLPYFISCCELFQKHNIPIYTFIPGDAEFRAPLRMGLPVMEHQRGQNAYVNYLEMARMHTGMRICVAEGRIYERHLRWIKEYEATGIITIPLASFDEYASRLDGREFAVRIEATDYSHRLEGTRKLLASDGEYVNASCRKRGSLQMDTGAYGRYEGEIHIMTTDAPLHPYVIRIAEIASPYQKLTEFLYGNPRVRFEVI